jgi:hypothetical protein
MYCSSVLHPVIEMMAQCCVAMQEVAGHLFKTGFASTCSLALTSNTQHDFSS